MGAELVEAQNANGGQDLRYDQLVELPFLDGVCRETMRLYVFYLLIRLQELIGFQIPTCTFRDQRVRCRCFLHDGALTKYCIVYRTQRDITMPLSEPMACADGSYTTSIAVPKGTLVMIAILSSNRNKAIWGGDADEWKPERWMNRQIPASVSEAKIPGVYSNL